MPLAIVLRCRVGRNTAGIEVVVIQDAVNIIIGNNLLAHGNDTVDGTLLSRVKDDGRAVGEQPAIVLEFLVLGCIPVGARAPSIGIHPSMTLHAALVATLDHILQRVKARILSTRSRQVTRPGLKARLIHRITHRAHLEVDSIEVIDLQ